MRALLAVAVCLALAAPARAADVARVPVGTEIRELFASPDGGAWVTITRAFEDNAIGRAEPDGTFRTFAAPLTTGGTIGPDGRAWFAAAEGVLRVDATGAMSTLPINDVTTALATAADGSVWALSLYGEQITHIAPDDTVTSSRLDIKGCTSVLGTDLARAADGAMWLTGSCGLVRVPPGGPGSVVLKAKGAQPLWFAADATDGVWYATVDGPGGGHVDARGRRTLLQHDIGPPTDVELGPDGAAWYATGKCTLARAAADGSVTLHRVPIPTFRLAFEPGGVWLASPARLVHTTLGAPAAGCDDKAPAVTVRPAVKRRLTMAALRRGFALRVGEPASLNATLFANDEPVADAVGTVRGGALRLRPTAGELRAVKPGNELLLLVDGRDREGNAISLTRRWRVTR